MFGGRRHLAGYIALVALVLFSVNCLAERRDHCDNSYYSSCGNIEKISYPFRLKGDPENCGVKKYELECDENNRTVLYLHDNNNNNSGKYYVEAINYNNNTIRVVDVGIHKDNCSSLPLYSLTSSDLYPYPYYLSSYYYYSESKPRAVVVFLNCDKPVKSPIYMDSTSTGSCFKEEGSSSPSNYSVKGGGGGGHSYVVMGELKVSDVADLCTVEMVIRTAKPLPPLLPGENRGNFTFFLDVHNALAYGFELRWRSVYSWSLCPSDWSSFRCA